MSIRTLPSSQNVSRGTLLHFLSARSSRPESLDCENGEHNEDHEDHGLGDQEWRLGSGRGQGMQSRYLQEALHDQNEDIQVEGDNASDYIDRTPDAGEVKRIARQNRHRQHHHGDDPNLVRWQKVSKRKEESS